MRLLSALMLAALGSSVQLSVHAAGLGKLTVFSALGQPLRAEVDITSVSKEEEGTLSARLAPPEAFRISNIEYNPVLGTVRFALEKKPDGRQVVRITSTQPVNEPFLDLLMELNWNSGKLVREYTVLLDPPSTRLAPVETTPAAPTVATRPATTPAPVAPPVTAAAAPSAAPPVATAPAPKSAPRPAPAARPSGTKAAPVAGDYTVKAGDTLSSIAARAGSSTVNLDQMLVAIYQANPDAFAGNMNRLKAGSVLRVPDQAAAGAISKPEARRIVIAETGNFSQYRQRVASTAAKAPAPTGEQTPKQAAAGSVTAKVEEKSKPQTPADQLKVDKPGAGTAGSTGQSVATAKQAELDKAAKDKAAKEAAARAAELEKNVKDLKAAEVKNQAMAAAQQAAKASTPAPAPAASPTPAPVAAAPTPVATPAPAATVAAAPTPAPAAAVASPAPAATATPAPSAAPTVAAATPTPAPAPAPAAPKPAAPAPVAQPSFVDELTENPMVPAGLGLIALLGGGYFLYRRRRTGSGGFEDSLNRADTIGANSVIGQAGGQSVDTSNTSSIFSSNFMPLANQLDAGDVDPVAEADVYIAYGRDAQAEEILKDAIKEQPDRHPVRLKLLEIYAARKDKGSFNAEALTLHERTKGMGEEWKKAAAMGAALDPANALYAVGAALAGASNPQGPMTQPAANVSPVTLSALPGATVLGGSTIMASPPTQSLSPPTMPAAPPDTRLDFNMTMPSLGGATEAMPTLTGVSTKSGTDFSLTEGKAPNDGMVDFSLTAPMVSPNDLDLSLDSATVNPKSRPGLDLDIGAATQISPATVAPAAAAKPAGLAPVAAAAAAGAVATAAAAATRKADPASLDFDLSGISFDGLGVDPSATTSVPVMKTPTSNDLTVSEMATKLNLASAYIQIGDKDGARELLNEVIAAGSNEQQQSARDMLGRMV